jgi:sugar lactone lactonase YvrE
MTPSFQTIASGFSFLEAPRWHAHRIWFSDIYDRRVYSAAEDGSDLRIEAETPGHPCGIDFSDDGRLLIALMQERTVLAREGNDELTTYANVDDGPLNDLALGRGGHLYVGAVDFDPSGGGPIRNGSLVHISPDGRVAVAAEDLSYPNGIAIADDRLLLVAESFGNCISSFRIQPDGAITDRGTFARFGPPPDSSNIVDALAGLDVTPDGCCLDVDGGLWVADVVHRRALRVREGGEITDTVEVDSEVFACMLGGDDGRTLFLCAAADSDPASCLATRTARLLAVSVDVRRGGRP